MGLFDFFRGKSDASRPEGGGGDRKVQGLAKVAGDKRAQTYDRLEAIQGLCAIKSTEAATALLKRFSFSIDPSITDQEEKEMAFGGVVSAGKDVVPAVLKHCERAENLTWPLKVLREVLDDDGYRKELVALLGRFDTEYERNVEPKLEVIKALEDVRGDDAREALEPYLGDVNETVRYHVIQTLFEQKSEASLGPMVDLLAEEESVRVKNKVLGGLADHGWVVPEDRREKVRDAMRDTYEFRLDDAGKVARR